MEDRTADRELDRAKAAMGTKYKKKMAGVVLKRGFCFCWQMAHASPEVPPSIKNQGSAQEVAHPKATKRF